MLSWFFQFSSVAQSCPTLCNPLNCSTPGFPITNSWSLLKLMSIESVMPANHLILCRPLLLRSSIFPRVRVFFNESALHIRWPEYWSFTFSISPSNEFSGLVSFRTDWFDLLAVQGTCKSLLQYHSSKASILWCLAFFMVQPSHPYVTTGKTIALTRQTFVSKVMSLLFNMLSRLLIAFPPRGKCLLIAWLQSPSAVILEPEKIKSVTVFIVSPSIFHKGMGPDVMIFVFLEYWVLIQLFHSPLSLSSRGSLVSLCLALSHCCLLLLCLFIVPRILQIYLIIPATPIIQFLPFKIAATFYGFLKMTPSSTALLPDFTTKL